MAPQPEVRIGERLRFYRQAKGKTQAVVAGLAGVTEDYLSQIERGLKTPTLPLVHRFSKILGVRVSELLGESATEHDERVLPVGYAVQRALMSYSGADGSPDLTSLRGRVDAAWSIWQGSPHRYSEISEVLPDLITDVQAAQRGLAHGSSPDERREADGGGEVEPRAYPACPAACGSTIPSRRPVSAPSHSRGIAGEIRWHLERFAEPGEQGPARPSLPRSPAHGRHPLGRDGRDAQGADGATRALQRPGREIYQHATSDRDRAIAKALGTFFREAQNAPGTPEEAPRRGEQDA